jgi:hypothetical protein
MNQINYHSPPDICATARKNYEVMATDSTDFTEREMLSSQFSPLFMSFDPISQPQGFDFSPVTTKHPNLIKSGRVPAHGQQTRTHYKYCGAESDCFTRSQSFRTGNRHEVGRSRQKPAIQTGLSRNVPPGPAMSRIRFFLGQVFLAMAGGACTPIQMLSAEFGLRNGQRLVTSSPTIQKTTGEGGSCRQKRWGGTVNPSASDAYRRITTLKKFSGQDTHLRTSRRPVFNWRNTFCVRSVEHPPIFARALWLT